MSLRSEYTLALAVALQKDTSMVGADALRVLERAASLPDESFPRVRADDVRAFVQHALGQGPAPSWVEEVSSVSPNPALDSVGVVYSRAGASKEWRANAQVVWDTVPLDLKPRLEDTIASGAHVSFTKEEWERVREWIASVPGEHAVELPFVLLGGEDHDDEG